jgi:hypothetical protein
MRLRLHAIGGQRDLRKSVVKVNRSLTNAETTSLPVTRPAQPVRLPQRAAQDLRRCVSGTEYFRGSAAADVRSGGLPFGMRIATAGSRSNRQASFELESHDYFCAHIDDAFTAEANGNTHIAIKVVHLAPPDRVGAGASTYVAWSEVGSGDAKQLQNLGAIRVDKDFSGQLETVSALTDFDLFITPEPAPTAQLPTGKEVLAVHISRNK